jgi:hypothetical protein
MVFLNELADVPADHVARVTHRHDVIEACRFKRRRAFDRPYLPPDCAGKYGARPFLRPVAKRDDIVKSFTEIWIDQLGPRR